MGRFVSATGQFLLTAHEQFSCPSTGSFRCPLTDLRDAVGRRRAVGGRSHHADARGVQGLP